MIDIETGFIPLSLLSTVSMKLFGKAASGVERVLCGILGKRTPRKHG